VFPVLEPFGQDLDFVYADQGKRDRYLYYPLYDTIKAIAQTYANLNRYKIVEIQNLLVPEKVGLASLVGSSNQQNIETNWD
jgi:cell surface protein SprA